MVIPPSQSFVCDNPLHLSFFHSHIASASAFLQGVQNASADPSAAQTVQLLISFGNNASITAPFHFPAPNLPQGMPPLSFPSPIQQVPNPHSHNFISLYLLLPPVAPMQHGTFPSQFQPAQGGVPPLAVNPTAVVPQGNAMLVLPTYAPVFHQQPFHPQLPYTHTSYNMPANSSNPHSYNPIHSVQLPHMIGLSYPDNCADIG